VTTDDSVNRFSLVCLAAKLARYRLVRSYCMGDLRGTPGTQATVIKNSIPEAESFLLSGTREERLAKNSQQEAALTEETNWGDTGEWREYTRKAKSDPQRPKTTSPGSPERHSKTVDHSRQRSLRRRRGTWLEEFKRRVGAR